MTVSTGTAFAADQTIALTLGGTATEISDYTIGSTSLTLTAGATSVTTTVTAVQDTIDEPDETVIVTASNGSTAIGSATVTITDDDAPGTIVANAPPTSSPSEVDVTEDMVYTFAAADFSFSDTDTGDTLSSVKVETLPALGSLTLSGAAVSAMDTVTKAQLDNGELKYTPAADGYGNDYATFLFRVNDGTADSAIRYPMDIDVMNVNDPPTGALAIVGEPTVGVTLSLDFSGVMDADGLPDKFEINWFHTDNNNRSLGIGSTYELIASDVGKNIKVFVEYEDMGGGKESIETASWPATGTIVDSNNEPTVANEIPDQEAVAGTSFSYQVPADTFNDADDDTLTYTANKADDASMLPTWLSFDAATRTFSGTPATTDTGTDSVQVTASDNNGGTTNDIFDILVVPALGVTFEDSITSDLAEGNSLDVPVLLSGAPGREVTITLSAEPSRGLSSSDYSVSSLSLTFGASETRKVVTVTATDDSEVDPGERLLLALPAPADLPTGIQLSSGDLKIINIVDNDFQYQASHADGTTLSVNEQAGTLTATVRVEAPDTSKIELGVINENVVLSVSTADGTATAGQDYTLLSQTLTFAPADFAAQHSGCPPPSPNFCARADKTVTVAITDDTAYEGATAETFTLTLSHETDQRVTYPSPAGETATVSIADDERPALTFTVAPTTILENGGTATVTLATTDGTGITADTAIALSLAGTATKGTDYTISSESLTLTAGQSSVTATITATMDAASDDNETVVVTASSGGTAIGTAQTVTITETLPALSIAVNPASIAEAAGTSTVTVSTGTPFTADQTIALTLGGTATEISDYTIGSTSLTLTAGETSVTTTVTAVQDTIDEPDETVIVSASNGGTAIGSATVTITDDDANSVPTVANAIPDQTATAGTAFRYQFPTNTFNDTDTGDTLSYMATKGDDTDLPAWLIFNATTRTFTGTPAAGDVGTLAVKVTATDTGSATVSNEFNIVVRPAAPAGFTAEAGDGRVRLSWTEPRPRVVHEYRYAAGASVPANAAWTSIGFSDQSTVLISGLANGTAHAFEVRVVGSGGVGPGAAAAVSATPAVAACSAPNLGGRRSVWSATLTVGPTTFSSDAIYAGYENRQGNTPYGSLSPTADFSIGGTSYTIASLETVVTNSNRRDIFLELVDSRTFPEAVRAALQFHWCGDSSRLDILNQDYRVTDDNFADWSIHTTREVALSLPANNDATGAPAVTGTAQVGQTLTAGKGDIADPDVLPATFPDDYAFQWVRVDADGTSNATDITNATANAYTLTADDVGKRVRVRVSFFDVLGGDEEILGALSGEVVSAPPAVSASLVSNLGQTEAAGILLSAFDVIQGFETGAGAYTLTSVDLRLKKGTAGAVFTIPSVKLTQGTTSGSSVTLTGPEVVLTAGVADVASGTANYTFTAPANTTLTGSTEYFIVVETVGSNSQWLTTSLPGEDATPADGWTINNNRARRNSSSTGSFTTRGRAQLMSINGITTTPPPPANTPPVVANAIPDQTATAGTAFRYAFPDTTFTDADSGDTLIYKATKGDGATLPSWLTFDPGTRAFSGTPTAADVGRVSVKVTATDTSSATASGDFDIVVSAATTTTPPATGSLVSNLGQTQHSGSLPLVTWDVVQGFAIADTASSNDYTLTSIDLRLFRDAGGTSIGAPGVQLVEGTKTATSVTFTGSPVTLTADVAEVTSTTGENYRFTAPSGTVLNASKRYFIRVEHVGTRVRWMTTAATGEDASPATDAGWSIDDERWRRSATNTGDFTNKVARSQLLRVNGNTTTSTNSAPTVATVIPDQTATEGTEFSYTFLPTTFNDTDAGDTLTYSATKADDTDLPTWLSFDAATRTFTGTPAAADLGTVSVKVTATDTGSATVSDDFDIVVIAAPPAGFRADEGDGRVRLVWTEPTPIIDHEYRYAAGASVPADTAWTVIGDAEQSTILISGLANGTAHAFEVRVVGSGGVSPGAAAAVSATPAVAACSAPNLGGRRSVWSATLTVGHMEFTSSYAAGYENRQGNTPYGSLSPSADFSIGGTSYTIALLETILRGRDRRTMFLGLAGSGTFPDAVRTALQLHWCGNSSGLQFLNPLYTVVNNNRADWSLHTTREVALSLPANNDATGTPTVTGTAQAGETLTAGMGNITDADGLPATFPGDYAFQWVRVDADGTSNATDITNATANAYTLTADDVGKRVRVRVSFFDVLGGDEEIPGALSGEVVSAPPANATPTVANEIPNQTAEAGTEFSYEVPANTFDDTDTGDTLTYSATKPDDSTLPTWLTFTAGTRTFAGTPTASDAGTLVVKVTATDTGSATVSNEFNIVVIPAAPAGFTAEAGDGRVRLSWTEPRPRVVHEYRYAAGASVPANAAWTSIGFSDQSTVLISGLTNGTAHAFEVRVVGNGGVGPGAAAAMSATPAVAACSAPSLGARRSVWSATLTVGRVGFGSAGYRQGSTPYGSLSPSADFSIGGTSYTIASLETIVRTGNRRQMFLDLAGSGTFPDAVRTALQFHWCGDSSGLDAPIPDYQITDDNDADWSIHTTREVALSLPANNDAAGAPTVTGTAQAGQTLTAGMGDIADSDGLPATFPDDYAFQWVRVDADGTSNATDITNATANAYTLTAADVGKRVRVRVSFFDVLGGDEEILGALSGEVVSAPMPAVANVLVSNSAEPLSSSGSSHYSAQSFQTGANTGGYTVTSVELRLSSGVTATGTRRSGSGRTTAVSRDVVATLTNPSPLTSNSFNTFTAPANTTRCERNVLDTTELEVVEELLRELPVTRRQDGVSGTGDFGGPVIQYRTSSSNLVLTINGTAQTTTPTNATPTVANEIPDQTAEAGTEFSYEVPTNTFNDTDTGDTLSYTATKPDDSTLPPGASTPPRGPSRARRRLRTWRRCQ